MKDKTESSDGVDVRAAKIIAAAERYVLAQSERKRLTRTRNAIDCERTAPTPDESWNAGGRPAIPVGPFQERQCWKATPESSDGGETVEWEAYGDGLPEGWCASCRRRQDLHSKLAAAGREVVASFNSLRRSVTGSRS